MAAVDRGGGGGSGGDGGGERWSRRDAAGRLPGNVRPPLNRAASPTIAQRSPFAALSSRSIQPTAVLVFYALGIPRFPFRSFSALNSDLGDLCPYPLPPHRGNACFPPLLLTTLPSLPLSLSILMLDALDEEKQESQSISNLLCSTQIDFSLYN